MNRKERAKQDWMARFEECVCALDSTLRGRIEWETATFHYNSGKTPQEAGRVYVHRSLTKEA